ncbi:MAG: outer membrane beta-barrel protein, partial [Pseudomonadota bacterium]
HADNLGEQRENSATEFGAGLNYHLFGDPFAFYRLIGYATFTAGMGKCSDYFNTSGYVTGVPEQASGNSTFWTLGIGGKYYLPNGFGMRLLLDYYHRNESYRYEEGVQDITQTLSGMRIQLGLSYRF